MVLCSILVEDGLKNKNSAGKRLPFIGGPVVLTRSAIVHGRETPVFVKAITITLDICREGSKL